MRTTLLAVVVALSGCATLPATGSPATGELLSVRETTDRFQVTEKVKVGETAHYTASGQYIGKSETYADQTRTVTTRDYAYYQGESRVDEQDFFEISGDARTAEEVSTSRNNLLTWNRVSLGAIGVGAATFIAGLIVNFMEASRSFAPYALMAAGGLLGGLGTYGAYFTSHLVSTDVHLIELPRGQRAAAQHNASLRTRPDAPVVTRPLVPTAMR